MQAIIFAYDVTRRETFESIQDTWLQEVAEHSNVEGAIKMVVANKVDRFRVQDWLLHQHVVTNLHILAN